MVREDLVSEIESKMHKLGRSPEEYDKLETLRRDSLVNLGDLYSFWIENPELRKSLLMENHKLARIQREAKKGIRQIQNAWYFISQYGKNCDFANVVDQKIIAGANALIDGGSAREGSFRRREVSLGFPEYRPTKPDEIPERVEEVISVIRENYFSDPLNTAIYTHLALALIQPFNSANKRTARLIQNRLLMDYGYPPAVIPAGEAKFYFDLLRKAVPAYKQREVDSKNQFFDYIASKVNNGLDFILGDLETGEEPVAV